MQYRKADADDLCRIAEIYVFNNRIHYFPIFQDAQYSFRELTVTGIIDRYFSRPEILDALYVAEEEGLIVGFTELHGTEIEKFYVDPFFQRKGIGAGMIRFAVETHGSDFLWALEKNEKARAFYHRCGFQENGERKYEEGTTEYLVKLVRKF